MTEEQAATLLGRKVRTLRKWRSDGSGPKFTRKGRTIWYRKTRIYEWLAEGEVSSNEEARETFTPAARR